MYTKEGYRVLIPDQHSGKNISLKTDFFSNFKENLFKDKTWTNMKPYKSLFNLVSINNSYVSLEITPDHRILKWHAIFPF